MNQDLNNHKSVAYRPKRENRGLPRVPASWSVRLDIPKGPSGQIRGRTLNVSRKGFLMELDAPINIGDTVVGMLHILKEGQLTRAAFKGEVKWSVLSSRPPNYQAGISILKMDAKDHYQLAEYVTNMLMQGKELP